MAASIYKIYKKIVIQRNRLIKLANELGMGHPSVLLESKKLDELVIAFQKLNKDTKKASNLNKNKNITMINNKEKEKEKEKKKNDP